MRREDQRPEAGSHRRGMHPLTALLAVEDARRIALGLVHPIERRESVSLDEAWRRVAAGDVRSRIDVPGTNRAAMDGYAVVAADTLLASTSRPSLLDRIETLHAADTPRRRVTKGHCTEVATGTTMPAGANAVVRVEDTRRHGDGVEVLARVAAGTNVATRGSDIRRGSVVIRSEEVLTPAKIGALAAIGAGRVAVYAKPRVAILTTGEELIPPGRAVRAGQVYDINTSTMAALIRENGGQAVLHRRIRDRRESLRAAMKEAVANDLVVCSGGSSVGEEDLVVDVVRSLGHVLFHGIAVKPGKPTALGRVDRTPVLGMPGFPTSCLNIGYVIMAPMLRRLARLPAADVRTVELPLATSIEHRPGRLEFHTVRVVDGKAVPAFKESSAITSMAHADGYIEIPAGTDLMTAGSVVQVTLF